MGNYDEEVKELIGRKAWKTIMREGKQGKIRKDQMDYIARLISRKVGGNHLRRGGCDDVELRHILSDWYNESLYGMDRTEALNYLVNIFDRKPVNLKNLASDLRELREKSKSRSRSKSHSRQDKKQTLSDILKEEAYSSPGRGQN